MKYFIVTSIVLGMLLASGQTRSEVNTPDTNTTTTPKAVSRGYSIPLIDLSNQTKPQVIVDKDPGQYLRLPTTVLLEDNKMRENARRLNFFFIFSNDEGKTWPEARLIWPGPAGYSCMAELKDGAIGIL